MKSAATVGRRVTMIAASHFGDTVRVTTLTLCSLSSARQIADQLVRDQFCLRAGGDMTQIYFDCLAQVPCVHADFYFLTA